MYNSFCDKYEFNPKILEDEEFFECCSRGGGILGIGVQHIEPESLFDGEIRDVVKFIIFRNEDKFYLDKLNLSWAVKNKKTGEYL
jgi:hypothetical protein